MLLHILGATALLSVEMVLTSLTRHELAVLGYAYALGV